MQETVIKAENVSLWYNISKDRPNSLKETVVSLLKGKRYKPEKFYALSDVSFEVKKGEVIGLVGRNGAGKSTMLKIIAGILTPSTGKVETRGNIVPMLELGSGFDSNLTGRENIFLNGAILGYSKNFLKERFDKIVEFSELGQFIDLPLRSYSSGMLARLAFSIATEVSPDILIVDEVLSVGDGNFQNKSYARMTELMKGGATVLFVSHSIGQVRRICEKALWLEKGKAVAFGGVKEICDRYEESIRQDQ